VAVDDALLMMPMLIRTSSRAVVAIVGNSSHSKALRMVFTEAEEQQ
jgi:hypothetical protein